ncbi:YphA family membrane protein [Alkalicoccobacillus porphyridii]|uniref:Uncharacterized protein n=1 Tax=Alkalicoccobacillus porphyridii TaxID=2597270 RepID=A0A553ZZM7_9BACI|nr:hypothetical protein [Alkalicoccobacillus porphyridii]TSB46898.1 hypothetical protein FN960_07705 [Alkalicoccobacillus porphyridii]
MIEGLLMYWLCWAAWITVTFLLPKSTKRYRYSVFILMFIILYSVNITIASSTLNVGMIWLSMGCYLHVRNQKALTLLFYMISAWLLSALYAGFSLWVLYDPIILIAPQSWMAAFIICFSSIFIAKDYKMKVGISILGMIHGEVLAQLVYGQIWGMYVIGDWMFYDVLAMVCVFFIFMGIFAACMRFFEKWVKSHPYASQSL